MTRYRFELRTLDNSTFHRAYFATNLESFAIVLERPYRVVRELLVGKAGR